MNSLQSIKVFVEKLRKHNIINLFNEEEQAPNFESNASTQKSFLSPITKRSRITTWANTFSFKRRQMRTISKIEYARRNFLIYLEKLLQEINGKLQHEHIDINNVGWALCLDNLIMKNFYLDSRDNVKALVKEKKLLSMSDPFTVVDQGDEFVWQKTQEAKLKPSSYYVHFHISDSFILSKLYQAIDTTESNGGVKNQSSLFIREKLIPMNNFYKEIADLVWCYVQATAEEKEVVCCHDCPLFNLVNFRTFKDKLIQFLKEEVLLFNFQVKFYA